MQSVTDYPFKKWIYYPETNDDTPASYYLDKENKKNQGMYLCMRKRRIYAPGFLIQPRLPLSSELWIRIVMACVYAATMPHNR